MERESHAFLIIIILVKRGQGFRQDIRLGGDGGLGSRSLEVIWNRSHPDSVDGYVRKVHGPLASELGFQEIIQSNTPKPWDHTHLVPISVSKL